jgi:hypothetical protein
MSTTVNAVPPKGTGYFRNHPYKAATAASACVVVVALAGWMLVCDHKWSLLAAPVQAVTAAPVSDKALGNAIGEGVGEKLMPVIVDQAKQQNTTVEKFNKMKADVQGIDSRLKVQENKPAFNKDLVKEGINEELEKFKKSIPPSVPWSHFKAFEGKFASLEGKVASFEPNFPKRSAA